LEEHCAGEGGHVFDVKQYVEAAKPEKDPQNHADDGEEVYDDVQEVEVYDGGGPPFGLGKWALTIVP
jgi:hypothetical protein